MEDLENKYYTPSLDEFYVGFEYEFKNIIETPSGDVESWDDQHWEYSLWYSDLLQYLKEDRIRVKYLDSEDIESLGFTYIKTHAGTTEMYFEKDNLALSFDPNFKYGKTGCNYLRIYEFKLNNSEIYYDLDSDITLFTGSIKNISELKKLLKQLNIN